MVVRLHRRPRRARRALHRPRLRIPHLPPITRTTTSAHRPRPRLHRPRLPPQSPLVPSPPRHPLAERAYQPQQPRVALSPSPQTRPPKTHHHHPKRHPRDLHRPPPRRHTDLSTTTTGSADRMNPTRPEPSERTRAPLGDSVLARDVSAERGEL